MIERWIVRVIPSLHREGIGDPSKDCHRWNEETIQVPRDSPTTGACCEPRMCRKVKVMTFILKTTLSVLTCDSSISPLIARLPDLAIDGCGVLQDRLGPGLQGHLTVRAL